MNKLSLSLVLLAAAGCGDDDPGAVDGGPPDAAPVADATEADAWTQPAEYPETPGYIHVTEYPDETGTAHVYTVIYGQLRDATIGAYTEVARAGDCRLYRSEPTGFCQMPCDGYCTPDGTCIPFPTRFSAGTMTFTGLAQAVDIDPDVTNTYSFYQNTGLTTPGATVTVSAPGDEVSGFQLSAPGVTPLEVTNLQDIRLEAGSDMTVTWTPANDPGARILLTLNSDTASHGVIHPAVIQCDVADTGTVTVPRELIDPFADPANWGCGDCECSTIVRYRRAVTTVDGNQVELLLRSNVNIYLIPPG